ncbi:hypothetical protein QM298_10550 [Pseudomonas mendocina]|nr:hypothetical protein [Pseudomonas mendocina]MDV5861347.1 hypothetical protein [Pseudomonas mendocina]
MNQILTTNLLQAGRMFISTLTYSSFPLAPHARDAETVSVPAGIEKEAPRVRQGIQSVKSIGAMLDSLDATYAALQRADDAASWVDKDLRDGLRRMGPYIATEDSRTEIDRVQVERFDSWPALLFVGLDTESAGNSEKVPCHFMFARKVKSFTNAVATAKGLHYEVGGAYYDNTTEKLFWVRTAATINPATGAITLATMKLHSWAAVGPANRRAYISRTSWRHVDIGDSRKATLVLISAAFNFWAERNEQWSVSTRRGDRRMTFCVPDRATSSFFRERDRVALTDTGRMRPIAHYVSEHERIYADGRRRIIPAHIRGMRKFSWKGYDCAIIAPEFKHASATTFGVAGVQGADEHAAKATISTSAMGKWIADFEDDQSVSSEVLSLA